MLLARDRRRRGRLGEQGGDVPAGGGTQRMPIGHRVQGEEHPPGHGHARAGGRGGDDLPEIERLDHDVGSGAVLGPVLDPIERVAACGVDGDGPQPRGGGLCVRGRVDVDGALPAGAVPDLSIDGTVIIDRLTNVLHAGRPASSAATGPTSVFRVERDGTTAVRVPVVLGRSSVNTIEILSGLAAGDTVVTP